MLAVSFDLIDAEFCAGGSGGPWQQAKALLGLCAGAYFIIASQGWLEQYER